MEADNAAPPVVQDIVRTNTASITTATTTTILDCTTANRRRNVKHINIYNNHASTACQVDVEHTDGTNVEVLASVNLLAGESLVLTQGGVWLHYDSNGAVYPAIGNKASQAEMEAGTADDKYVTPLGVHWHPGVLKCWGKANGAGTSLIVNWNVSGISDTGTGRLGVTIGTDFSSADYSATTSVERVSTSLAVANVDNGGLFRNAGFTAGVFEIENYDDTATTHAAQDPANYFWQCAGDQA
jgi:hypothetical protein